MSGTSKKKLEKPNHVFFRKNGAVKTEGRKKKSKPVSISRAPAMPSLEDPEVKGSRLLIRPDGKWYDHFPESDALQDPGEEQPLKREELASVQSKAEKLLSKDIQAYKSESMRRDQRSDFLWMDKIMRTGTLPDKMAAFAVRIQDSPVHNLSCLQQLIGMVKVQGKQQCLMTADATRDLFLQDLLPTNRKLVTLEQRGPKLRSASNKQLVLWLFEDKLKGYYRDFIEALRRMSSDTIEKLRGKAISVIQQLLSSHPEQEHILLPLLVNKLGDPVKKVGSRALFHLNKLLEQHPQMKAVVVQEVERLLFRTNIGKRAQYYGICFLNGIRVLGDESTVAIKLVKVYLAFFKACIKTGEIDSKMMSGLLSGVNKAFPAAKMDGYEFSESLDTLYKIVQLSQFNIGVQALALLLQVTDAEKDPKQADRFYRILYRKLLSPELATTSHGMQFLNVIYKAMKKDAVRSRVIAYTKRLLQLCIHMPPNLACSILFLISEVSRSHKDILLLGTDVSRPDSSSETAEAASEDETGQIDGFGNQVKRSNQIDVDALLKNTNIKFDTPEQEDHPPQKTKKTKAPRSSAVELAPSPAQDTDEVVEVKEEKFSPITEYDPNARNPSFCGADLTLSYELISLLQHFHPSVALFSQTLLNRQFIKYDGNPLKDFTVGRFLERFVYRNPKQKKLHQEYQPQGLRNVPVNSAAYLQTEEEKIPIEERFFYKFFKAQNTVSVRKKKKTKSEEDESDVESVDDEEFDDFMDNYFKTEDGDEEEVDFAAEVKKLTKGKKRKAEEEEAESEEDDDEDDDDDEAIDFDGDEDADELIDLDDPGDEEDFDDDFEEFGGKAFKEKLQLTTQRKSKSSRADAMFAPAEEFSQMLESNADVAFTGSNTLINKDNSNVKQLKWETDRDRWVKGYKNNSGKSRVQKKRKF